MGAGAPESVDLEGGVLRQNPIEFDDGVAECVGVFVQPSQSAPGNVMSDDVGQR
jgi:hypothetical protein